MKVVKFIRPTAPYTTDDIAGFEDAVADKFLSAGYAVPYEPEAKRGPEPTKVADLEEKKIIDPAPAKTAPGPAKKVTPVTKGA